MKIHDDMTLTEVKAFVAANPSYFTRSSGFYEKRFYRFQSKFPKELMEIAIEQFEEKKQELIWLAITQGEDGFISEPDMNDWIWLEAIREDNVKTETINRQLYYDDEIKASKAGLYTGEKCGNEILYVYEEYCKYLFPDYHCKFVNIVK